MVRCLVSMICKIENIKKSYTLNGKQKDVLKGISFQLEENQIYGLIGLNGSGKSTLIKIISGIISPDEGISEVFNIPSSKLTTSDFKKISILFGQKSTLWWDLPAIDSFELYKVMYDISDNSYQEMMQYLTSHLNITPILNQTVRTLSLGQKTILNIALAFLMKPEFVILDEPTLGLDFLIRKQIRNFLKDYKNDFHTTIIITSHDTEDITDVCNNLLLLDKGEIIYKGSLSYFKNNYMNENNYYSIEIPNKDAIDSTFFHNLTKKNNNEYLCNEDTWNQYQKEILKMISKHYITSIQCYGNDLTNILEHYYAK